MDMFSALAQPTRRNIMEMLASRGQLSASDIYHKFPASPPAISQHLKVLRDTKLVNVEKRAQQRFYTINTHSIQKVEDWAKKMKHVWNERFERIEEVLKHG